LLHWLSNNLALFLERFITDDEIACIFFLKCILKSLIFLENGIVVQIKWIILVYLQTTSLGGIACLSLFGMISIILAGFILCFVDFVVYA
jgi:hypothetical protein